MADEPHGWRASAPAKINLGLFVGTKRADGRHELVSVMQSISLADELTLRPAPPGATSDTVECPGVEGPNLATAALQAFRAAAPWAGPAQLLSIDKRVPVAAGLGGGSGDAAAALRLAVAASGLGDRALLLELAATLGADVPAQVRPGRWLAGGAGERLQALPDPYPPFGVLVLPVAAHLSTAAVYAEADRLGRLRSDRELARLEQQLHASLDLGVSSAPAELLANDLQPAARRLCRAVDRALADATDAGADVVFVSGSGPTVVGLFLRANFQARLERALQALAGRDPAPVAAHPVGAAFGEPAPFAGAADADLADPASPVVRHNPGQGSIT